jgi:hypothetical protein
MPLALTAAPYILSGISALGGIFGKKRKYMDPEILRQKYGPNAIADDTQRMVEHIMNSPYGQQILSQATQSGNEVAQKLEQNGVASGMNPTGGAGGGASSFASATAPQIANGQVQQAKAGLWQAAMPAMAGMNQNLANVAVAGQNFDNSQPNTWEKIAAGAGSMASGAKQWAPDWAAAHPTKP